MDIHVGDRLVMKKQLKRIFGKCSGAESRWMYPAGRSRNRSECGRISAESFVYA